MSILRKLLEELHHLLGHVQKDEESLKTHIAFRLTSSLLVPVKNPHVPDPELLVGVDKQKETLFKNTERFVSGLPANDALLWGARGTGKSSLVKSLLKPFASRGLRIIQITKEGIPKLWELYELLGNRKERFILFFDDLSFTPRDESFLALKSLMDGDIEERPRNVLIYVTTNRRNLIPQNGDEKFEEDAYNERVSLAERFGIRLYFPPMGKREFLEAVKANLRAFGVEPTKEALEESVRFATERGGFSGRCALHFAKDWVGRINSGEKTSPYQRET
ncbi:MAG: ATP-binding protein [Aquificae bacterium]|nr:ATP-binding protein [Aquificota bacterium]